MNTNCFPGRCGCCECQGKKCLMYHPGHDHRINSYETLYRDALTTETCPRCGESKQLAKVKGCVKCLKCGYKFDCEGF